jgi:bifunctional UDP-N-acetylglucosamine pyrophosphorylase/glucosamine-1-phosphate N-acetyltransferase
MVPKIEGEVEERATLNGPVSVGKGSTVRNGAYIVGPVIIGEGSDIGPNCYIRPSTYIGDGCKVGNGCEVKNSIVMNGSHVPHLNYLGDSVLGHRCNLGAGTKVANLRLDGANIKVTVKGERVDTGLRKLGVIMGDDVKTGINASFDVGAIIGEGCFIGPGALASGNIAPRSRVM